MEALFGGRNLTIIHEDGAAEEIKVRQLHLADYEKGLRLVQDEFGLVAFICGKDKAWLLAEDGAALKPEAYELLRAAAWEVNEKGFFTFAARKVADQKRAQEEIIKSLADLPPETVKAVLAEGAKYTWPTGSPK